MFVGKGGFLKHTNIKKKIELKYWSKYYFNYTLTIFGTSLRPYSSWIKITLI